MNTYQEGKTYVHHKQREKEFWVYFWLFTACSTTVLSKAIQKFLLVMKLASY